MAIHGGRAFLAGVIGGASMSVAMALARELGGTPIGLELAMGELTGLPAGRGTFAVGLVIHLVVSGVVAMLYAVGFERVTHRAGPGAGLVLAIPHTLLAAIALGALSGLGPFFHALGGDGIALFLAMHAAYGAIVGAVYRPAALGEPALETPARRAA